MPLLPEKISMDEVGGEKIDYGEVVDSETDRSAEEINIAFAGVSMMSRTALRFAARIATDSSGDGYLVSGTTWDSVWKGQTTTAPVIAHPSTGIYTITLPGTVTDELLETHSVNLFAPWAESESQTTFYHLQAKATNSNVISVAVFDDTGNLADIIDDIWKVYSL